MDQLIDEMKIFTENYVSRKKMISMDQKTVDRLCSLAIFYNRLHSESDIGDVIDRGSFESTFHIKWYIESDLDFIIQLFANHTKAHQFHNGNKRTAFEIFNYFINTYSPFKLKKELDIEQCQINLIEGKLEKDDFSLIILDNLVVKMAQPKDKVKLEKLIRRGNVTEGSESSNQKKYNITLKDLKSDDLFFKLLRKPYFQRDTNSWDLSKIDNIINSFTENMLIPSVILWNSKSDGIFIVDGAHRISALAAWVNDDYGSALDYSKHLQVKHYIESIYGNYDNLVQSDDLDKSQVLNTIATKAINIEWITGDYELVKNSFIRINEQGVEITNDEKEIIKNDSTSSAILSRSILSYSGGQVSSHQNDSTENLYKMLFLPSYSKINRIVPMAGNLYDDFIISRVYNLIKVIDDGKQYSYDDLLNKTSMLINLMVNELQLNNRVYFYGVTYKYKQSAFVGITRLVMKLVELDKINFLISNREGFEEYLVENPEHIQTIVRKGRYVKKAMNDLEIYYFAVLEYVSTGDDKDLNERFSYLNDKKKTDRMIKIEEKYKDEIAALNKCKVCGGYINNFEQIEIHKICKGD